MRARILWDKILRAGIKLCMLTGVAFTFAACYAPAYEPYLFEASGDVTNEENEPLEHIEVAIKSEGHPLFRDYSDQEGRYLIRIDCPHLPDSLDVIARDTSGVYAPDSVRVKVEIDTKAVKHKGQEGTYIIRQAFQLKKK